MKTMTKTITATFLSLFTATAFASPQHDAESSHRSMSQGKSQQQNNYNQQGYSQQRTQYSQPNYQQQGHNQQRTQYSQPNYQQDYNQQSGRPNQQYGTQYNQNNHQYDMGQGKGSAQSTRYNQYSYGNQQVQYQSQQGRLMQRGQQNQVQANWSVGKKVPQQYRHTQYHVNYQQHNLPKPAKNQRWIEVDGQYILMNILTNAIIQILLAH